MRSLGHKFSSIKQAVKFLLLFAEAFPLEQPNRPYKEVVRSIAQAAEDKIRAALKTKEPLTVYSLERVEKEVRTRLEEGKSLPSDTPSDWKKWF